MLPTGNIGHFKELIKVADSSGITGSRNSIGMDGIYAVSTPRKILGTMLTAHIFYSPQKRALEEEALYARVSRLEIEPNTMKRMKKLPKKYSELFKIESGGNAVTSFTRDFDKIDTQLAQKGYFVLATNDERLTSAEVLRVYRNKDVIEKAFSSMKNQLDLKRMRTHSSVTTDGKLFCGFNVTTNRLARVSPRSSLKPICFNVKPSEPSVAHSYGMLSIHRLFYQVVFLFYQNNYSNRAF